LAERRIIIPYSPRAAFKPFHERKQRFSVIVAHRRAGKTVAAINDLIKAALTCNLPDPRFAYIAPYYAQAKDVAWNYLKHYTAPIPGATTNESELRVDLPGGRRVRLYGADNFDRMRGIYLDGVVHDEFADMDPRAWSEVIRPALSDRKGWAAFIGTAKGQNAFYDLLERAKTSDEWFHAILKASTTGIIAEPELAALKAEMSEDEYAREMECSFDAAIEGAYYARLLNEAEADRPSRIGKVPVDPYLPVHAAFDLGIGDATAIWLAQFQGREIRLVDYIENTGVPLSWYGNALRERGHSYAPLILPHDAQARELGTGKSRVEMMQAMGFATNVLPASSVEDGIETVRRFLPRTWIDAEKCNAGLQAVKQYRARKDEKRRLSLGPLHDWTSHAADALRYLMVAYEEPQVKRDAARRPRPTGQTAWMGR
jgi:phage terminase large subunit